MSYKNILFYKTLADFAYDVDNKDKFLNSFILSISSFSKSFWLKKSKY